jgi:hypothetical protein
MSKEKPYGKKYLEYDLKEGDTLKYKGDSYKVVRGEEATLKASFSFSGDENEWIYIKGPHTVSNSNGYYGLRSLNPATIESIKRFNPYGGMYIHYRVEEGDEIKVGGSNYVIVRAAEANEHGLSGKENDYILAKNLDTLTYTRITVLDDQDLSTLKRKPSMKEPGKAYKDVGLKYEDRILYDREKWTIIPLKYAKELGMDTDDDDNENDYVYIKTEGGSVDYISAYDIKEMLEDGTIVVVRSKKKELFKNGVKHGDIVHTKYDKYIVVDKARATVWPFYNPDTDTYIYVKSEDTGVVNQIEPEEIVSPLKDSTTKKSKQKTPGKAYRLAKLKYGDWIDYRGDKLQVISAKKAKEWIENEHEHPKGWIEGHRAQFNEETEVYAQENRYTEADNFRWLGWGRVDKFTLDQLDGGMQKIPPPKEKSKSKLGRAYVEAGVKYGTRFLRKDGVEFEVISVEEALAWIKNENLSVKIYKKSYKANMDEDTEVWGKMVLTDSSGYGGIVAFKSKDIIGNITTTKVEFTDAQSKVVEKKSNLGFPKAYVKAGVKPGDTIIVGENSWQVIGEREAVESYFDYTDINTYVYVKGSTYGTVRKFLPEEIPEQKIVKQGEKKMSLMERLGTAASRAGNIHKKSAKSAAAVKVADIIVEVLDKHLKIKLKFLKKIPVVGDVRTPVFVAAIHFLLWGGKNSIPYSRDMMPSVEAAMEGTSFEVWRKLLDSVTPMMDDLYNQLKKHNLLDAAKEAPTKKSKK